MNATQFVSTEERARVAEAIGAAERRTAAEIVCAVATESGRYDRAEAIVGVFCAVLGLWAVNTAVGWDASAEGAWGEAPRVAFVWQALGTVVGFVLGNLLASYAHGVRRLVVSAAEVEAELERAASHVFTSRRLASTRGRGGLLLYVSLFERRVLVRADQGAFAVLGQAGVDALRDLAVSRLRAGDRVGTLVATVERAAELLAEKLPREEDDADELSDELLVYHPRP